MASNVLTGVRKAAILLLTLSQEEAAEILKRLSDESVRYIILSDPDEQKELEDVERRAKEQVEILHFLGWRQ